MKFRKRNPLPDSSPDTLDLRVNGMKLKVVGPSTKWIALAILVVAYICQV
jgi:hypothetical protein